MPRIHGSKITELQKYSVAKIHGSKNTGFQEWTQGFKGTTYSKDCTKFLRMKEKLKKMARFGLGWVIPILFVAPGAKG